VARILFAHGHVLRFDRKLFAIGKPYPPLATLFAASHARALGHEVVVFDPMLDEAIGGFSRALDATRPDVVVLYDDAFNWFTKMCLSRMREAACRMVREASARGLTTIVVGHDAGDDPAAYLAAGATLVVAGEGEITLGELLGRLEEVHRDPRAAVEDTAAQVPGLVYLRGGSLHRTGPRKLLRNLDDLPLPAWDLADLDRYRDFWRRRHGYFSLNMVTTRGCPYRCNWCSKPVYGNTYHSRTPANVVSEMQLLRDRYAPDHIWFCDDILGLKPRWLVEWSEAVVREGLVTPFLCQTRVDLMTEDGVRALRRAGCAEAWLGAESGSQRILDAMDKGITLEQTRLAVSRLHEQGVRVGLFLQFGYEGEGWKEIQQTRDMVRELLPDDIGISVSYPLPGTRYYERVAARLGEKRNWRESSDLDPLVHGPSANDFYPTLSRVVHAELRVRRGARAFNGIVRKPRQADRALFRQASGLRHAGRWLLDRARLEILRRKATLTAGRPGLYTPRVPERRS
jgi:anaerobic magnesium-protoporphyrin IX monomethyl ester cyclase